VAVRAGVAVGRRRGMRVRGRGGALSRSPATATAHRPCHVVGLVRSAGQPRPRPRTDHAMWSGWCAPPVTRDHASTPIAAPVPRSPRPHTDRATWSGWCAPPVTRDHASTPIAAPAHRPRQHTDRATWSGWCAQLVTRDRARAPTMPRGRVGAHRRSPATASTHRPSRPRAGWRPEAGQRHEPQPMRL